MDPHEKGVEYQELVLERLKTAARAQLSPALLHDLHADVHVDHMTQRLVAQLQTYLLAERLLTEDQSASFSEEVVIEQPAPRWLVIPPAALVIGTTALGIALGNMALVLVAMATALVAVAIHARNPPRTHRRTVSATVTIPVTSYATFPHNETVYPKSLGPVVAVMEPGSPYWR